MTGMGQGPEGRSEGSEFQRLAAIVTAQSEIVAELDLDRVMHLITERAQELTGASGAKIQLVDGDDFVNVTGCGSAARRRGLRYPRTGSLSGICVVTGEVMRADDTERDPRVNLQACRDVSARSLLLAPLFHAQEVLGVLAAISDQPRAFDDRDVDSLQLMAGLLGNALGTARAFSAERALLAERTAALDALAESERRFRQAFDTAPIGMALVSGEDGFLQVNQALCAITGYREADLLVWGLDALRLPEDPELDEPAVAGEHRYLRSDGRPVWLRVTTSPVAGANGQPRYEIVRVEDVTAQRRAEARLRELALHDPLTGLPNGDLLRERLAVALERARRAGALAALLLVDLEGFDEVHERFGQQAGDQVLVGVAARLREALRPQDTPARTAGEHFAVVCDGLPHRTEAMTIADRIRTALAVPHLLAGGLAAVTASIGVVVTDGHDTVTGLLREAAAARDVSQPAG